MGEKTSIEWTDSSWNPWMGCTKVSPACDHCYAERHTARFKSVEWGAGKPRVRTSAANWKLPERWNRLPFYECAQCGWRGDKPALTHSDEALCWSCCAEPSTLKPARRRVFCASLADWLDNEVPIEWLVDLLDLIRRTPNLDWLLLTKRIGNWRGRVDEAATYRLAQILADSGDPKTDELWQWLKHWLFGNPPANVCVGSTVIDQPELDRDLLKLYRVPAVVRFLSAEPMLGPMNFDCFPIFNQDGRQLLHWIIAGGESGPHARPMHPDWVRSLRDQCAEAGVPFMVKQLSSGGSKPLKDLSDFPSDLRIRQFPEVSS